jgi:predicted small lipoprotein YifL
MKTSLKWKCAALATAVLLAACGGSDEPWCRSVTA